MQISGDNWDAVILRRLLDSMNGSDLAVPPLDLARAVFLEEAGKSFAHYLVGTAPKIGALTGDSFGLVAEKMTQAFAVYYALMTRCARLTRPAFKTAAAAPLQSFAGIHPDLQTRIFLTFQIGLPLFTPYIARALNRRRTVALVHSNNTVAVDFMRTTGAVPLALETAGFFELAELLRRRNNLVANIDVAYPGVRTATINIFGHRLDIPVGVISLARRANCGIACIAAIREEDAIFRVETSPALDISETAATLSAIEGFFQPLIAANPYQWMGWGGLR